VNRVVCAAMFLSVASGCGMPSFLVTPVQNTSSLEEQQVSGGKGFGGGKIAIIEVEGMIANMKSGGFMQPTENQVSRFAQEMEKAAKDPAVKAGVLRGDSPGGAGAGA